MSCRSFAPRRRSSLWPLLCRIAAGSYFSPPFLVWRHPSCIPLPPAPTPPSPLEPALFPARSAQISAATCVTAGTAAENPPEAGPPNTPSRRKAQGERRKSPTQSLIPNTPHTTPEHQGKREENPPNTQHLIPNSRPLN